MKQKQIQHLDEKEDSDNDECLERPKDEIRQPTPTEPQKKAKRPRSEKQIAAFNKIRADRSEKAAAKREILMKEKQLQDAIQEENLKLKQKELKRGEKYLNKIKEAAASDDETEEEVVVVKKAKPKKKKIIYETDSDSEEEAIVKTKRPKQVVINNNYSQPPAQQRGRQIRDEEPLPLFL
jgi:hypothetical protein